MKQRFAKLQSIMIPLRVFEAAARHGSFTRAGEELRLSQPSVSRHIATLEQALGAALFTRNHNKLSLTPDGQRLAGAVDRGFSDILQTIELISTSAPRRGVVLACTQTFAHGWLLPRFSGLRRVLGDVPINLNVSYWLKDINLNDVDMVIGWRADGETDWPKQPLFAAQVYPVASPEFAAGLTGGHLTPDQLLRAPLLQYDMPVGAHVFWPEWFAHFGQRYTPPTDGYLHSNYQFMLQAAIDGDGVALGWHHLVADDIRAGRLMQVGPAFAPQSSVYSIEYKPDLADHPDVKRVLNWFADEAARLPRISM